MTDIWTLLEERTRAWHALGRQGLADAIWADYVTVRFGRSGDLRALEFLYPYLNHAQKYTRLVALAVAARVFEGRGVHSLDALDYFTRHPDPFLRDRSVRLVGAAVKGSAPAAILETLAPYLDHPNQFIRKHALIALGDASEGQADPQVVAEIRRVGKLPGPPPDEVLQVVARACASRPSDETYGLLARHEKVERIDVGAETAISRLVRGASQEWYERACREIFEPRLRMDHELTWYRNLIRRQGISALTHAGRGLGMDPFRRVMDLRNAGCMGLAMLNNLIECFAGADSEEHRGPLLELTRDGDLQQQRMAALCLGRLVMGEDDAESIDALVRMCGARSGAVRAAALRGLGMAARSTCDEALWQLCLDRAAVDETATAAIGALGMVYLGSGRADVFGAIRDLAARFRARPVRSRRHIKSLQACYRAAGLVYLGTGAEEPVEFLLDVLARHRTSGGAVYGATASRSLVMIDFSETALGWPMIAENALPHGTMWWPSRFQLMTGRQVL
jgi:hypothetical protein